MRTWRFNRWIRVLFLAWGSCALESSGVSAAGIPGLSELVRRQLQEVPPAVAACSLPRDETGAEAWEYTRFFLGVNPYVSFGVPGFARLTVSPEIQFVWSTSDDGAE